jgi:hypothetical protein
MLQQDVSGKAMILDVLDSVIWFERWPESYTIHFHAPPTILVF